MDVEEQKESVSVPLAPLKGTAEIVEDEGKPSPQESVRKKKPLSREEHLQEEKRERIRNFLKKRHRDKLHFPTEEVPQGMEYRWVREDCRGRPDLSRIALMTKKGWTPVPFDRHPTFLAETLWAGSSSAVKPDVIRVDGLILCERPAEFGQIERETLEAETAETLKKVKWITGDIDAKDRQVYINRTSYEAESELD